MIRKFQKADSEQVMQIWLNGNMDAHPFIPKEYWESNFGMVREQLLQAEVFVCELHGDIQGFIGIADAYIAGIFVDKRHRSHGVGEKLLDYVKQKYSSLSLDVYRKNNRAVLFYLREGFSILSERLDEATREAEYTMVWDVKNGTDKAIICSSEADSSYLHEKLREYNARYMHESGDFNFHIEDKGRIIGGIVAGGLGDTLEVEFLYVEGQYRGKGIGRRLLAHVEALARQNGLKRILLNTYSFQAPEFYRKLGYTEILKLSPAFDGFAQSYFIKEL